MTFWATLRWVGALILVLLVLMSWLGAERSDGSLDQQARPAPLIVR